MHPFVLYLSERLKQPLAKPLPGWKAQMKMAPKARVETSPLYVPNPPSEQKPPKKGSVLAPLVLDKHGELNLILTLRGSNLNSHGGQISFPGGRIEPDESPEQAALREANEETGISPEKVQVLGQLTHLFIPPSNNIVSPFVGFLPEMPAMRPNPGEVEEILVVGLHEFTNPDNFKTETWRLRNREEEVNFWSIHPTPLWGATAMMISELMELYQEFSR